MLCKNFRLDEFPEGIYSLKELRSLQLNTNKIPAIDEKIR
jgi:Leucine-rich repeat (LRR) protein